MKVGEIEVIEVEQGSPEWYAAKLGIPSASNFSDALAGGAGKVRDLYMRKLAGEIVTGVPREGYRGGAMDRGNAMEPELRAIYAMMTGAKPEQVGFIKRRESFGTIGCSPDSLIGDDGGVEYKSAAPHVLIEILKADRVPPEHVPQLQGNMLVTGRPWWDIVIGYSLIGDRPEDRQMPMFQRRIKRDESAIARLRIGLEAFYQDLDYLVRWLRAYGKN